VRDLIAHILSRQPQNATAAGGLGSPGELAPVRGRRDDRLAQPDGVPHPEHRGGQAHDRNGVRGRFRN
jgi:hypothetical protein